MSSSPRGRGQARRLHKDAVHTAVVRNEENADGTAFDALLTPVEVSLRLKVSIKTLANWRVSGRGPSFRKLGGAGGSAAVRYSEAALLRWLDGPRS